MNNIPLQHRVTMQILKHCQSFRDLKLTFVVSLRTEKVRVRTQERIIATTEDSVLRTEMDNLEPLDEETPKRVLSFKSTSCLGQLRTHHRDETRSASLWHPFFAVCVGANIPAQEDLPLSTCGCKKFTIDDLGDHVRICTDHSGAKKSHD